MIRFVLRLYGLCIFASGFVACVIDGSRSIAGGAFLPTSMMAVLEALIPDFAAGMAVFLQSIRLGMAEGFVSWVLGYPASIMLVLTGLILLWIGRKPRPLLGLRQS